MNTKNKSGRKKIIDPRTHRYFIKLNDSENAEFLKMFDETGLKYKADFITSRIFNQPFRVIKIDKSTNDFYRKLTTFYSQYRSIGVNYNQIVKTLKANFSEKKAMAMLYRLEKTTIELIEVTKELIVLTEKFEKEYIKKPENDS